MTSAPLTVPARPYDFTFDPATTALVVIDMQRDFMEPGGFGESLGNDVSQLRSTIEPLKAVFAAARAAGLTVIHTREGHLPDLSDLPPAKLNRGNATLKIGDVGPKKGVVLFALPDTKEIEPNQTLHILNDGTWPADIVLHVLDDD